MKTDQVEMPRYRCFKEVHALKIREVLDTTKAGNESDGSRLLSFDAPYGPVRVDVAFVRKHEPTVGTYYVVYQDGYASISPAEAFESGYSRV